MATLDSDDLTAITAIVDARADALLLEFAAMIVEGANQVDGGGEVGVTDVTLVQAIREVLGYCAGDATGLEGPQAIVKSRGGGRNRLVASLVNGNRSVTSRNNL